MMGRDVGDPLVLQCKEAQASVLEPYAGASEYANSGQRVVEGQRLMQAASDIFLGWLPAIGIDACTRDFYVRQLWDGKLRWTSRAMGHEQLRDYGAPLRLDARTRPRALRRPHRDRRLSGQGRRLRPGPRGVRRRVLGAEPPRLPGAARCYRVGTAAGAGGLRAGRGAPGPRTGVCGSYFAPRAWAMQLLRAACLGDGRAGSPRCC